jgi:hypothetical protein
MSREFELFFKDLTKVAQDRMMEFDPEVSLPIQNSEESFLRINKKEPDQILDEVVKKIAGILGKDAPSAIIKAVAQQAVNGEELGGGFVMDKLTGKVTSMTDEEMAELKKATGLEVQEVPLAPTNDDGLGCNCLSCQVERKLKKKQDANSQTSFGSKGDNGGIDPLGIVARREPKDPEKWD